MLNPLAFFVVFAIFTFTSFASAQSAAGMLDASFGDHGKVIASLSSAGFNVAKNSRVLSDGSILVSATTSDGFGYYFSVLKYSSNGSPDPSFGIDGWASVPATSSDKMAGIVVLPDGRIVVGVTSYVLIGSSFKRRFALIRFTAGGAVDSTFGQSGKVVLPALGPDGDSMAGIALQADGKIVMAGDTGNPTPNTIVTVRCNADGSLDNTFAGNGIELTPVGSSTIPDYAAGVVVQSDGRIVVVGDGWETGRDVLAIRYNADGSLDTAFGGDGIVTIRIFGQASRGRAVALQPDGKIVIAGDVISSFLVVRLNSDGSLDTSFNSTGFNYVSFQGSSSPDAVVIQSNGKIILGGGGQSTSNSPDFGLARFNQDGKPDTSFSGDGLVTTAFGGAQGDADVIHGMIIQPDGKVIAVGEGASYPPSITIARYITANTSIGDFDGDGKSDEAVFRPSNGTWHLNRSTLGFNGSQFGTTGDLITPADFTGDGKTDVAVFRPSSGTWFVLKSEDNTFFGAQFGANGDIPAPADYDGDGKADTAVFRPSTGTWFIQGSTTGFTATQFGMNGDVPTVGDFDGDGKSDVAVFRPSNGTWFRLNSSNGAFVGTQFGQNGDKVVAADYTGDGKTDIAVWRPSEGTWYIQKSEDNSFYGVQFGMTGDLPTPGDYDGDGKADVAVFRPSSGTWFEQRSTTGFAAVQFGVQGDKPAPNAFVY